MKENLTWGQLTERVLQTTLVGGVAVVTLCGLAMLIKKTITYLVAG